MAHTKCLTKLDPSKTLFLLCDVQEKFRKALPLFGNMVQNINKLLRVGKALEVPLIVTEQYPKGLGNTVKEIDSSDALAIIPKTKFTMFLPEMQCFIKELVKTHPENVVLFGLETHVCILQSAMDFLENDYRVHVVADCCCSRMNQDRDVALDLLRQMGCFVQTSESVIFSLTQDKMHPKFETVKKAVAAVSADMEIAKIVPKDHSLTSNKEGKSESIKDDKDNSVLKNDINKKPIKKL